MWCLCISPTSCTSFVKLARMRARTHRPSAPPRWRGTRARIATAAYPRKAHPRAGRFRCRAPVGLRPRQAWDRRRCDGVQDRPGIRHHLRMQIDIGGIFRRAHDAGIRIGFLYDVVRHRLHHHEIDMCDLVITIANGVQWPHAVRDVSMHVQPQLVCQRGHRLDPGGIDRTVNLDREIAFVFRAMHIGQRFIQVVRDDTHLCRKGAGRRRSAATARCGGPAIRQLRCASSAWWIRLGKLPGSRTLVISEASSSGPVELSPNAGDCPTGRDQCFAV